VGDRFDITPPAEVAAHLNRLFPLDAATEQLTTLVYGILDATTGEFRYVSAGHPGPVHLPAASHPVILASDGYPIGLTDEAYEERSVRLRAGDRLYLYSDGMPEAMNATGEQFGNDRLLATIRQSGAQSFKESAAALMLRIEQWLGPERPQDDISILAIECARDQAN
jgi:sigma-B regulation protein RsbU (phosphoserine phosphatase)